MELMIQGKSYKGKPIIGTIGVFAVAGIVCTFGPIQLHWNCQMVQMDGSVSYSMANWLLCIRAAVRKMATIILVHSLFELFSSSSCSFRLFIV